MVVCVCVCEYASHPCKVIKPQIDRNFIEEHEIHDDCTLITMVSFVRVNMKS